MSNAPPFPTTANPPNARALQEVEEDDDDEEEDSDDDVPDLDDGRD